MKKITLMVLASLISMSVFAQMPLAQNLTTHSGFPVSKTTTDKMHQVDSKVLGNRGAYDRWYAYYSAYDSSNGFTGATYVDYIFPDSTILVKYSNGSFPPNFTSVATVLDPTAETFNDPNNYAGRMSVTKGVAYTIDSVGIWIQYHRQAALKNADTLVLNVIGNNKNANMSLTKITTAINGTTVYFAQNMNLDSLYWYAPPYNYKTDAMSGTGLTSIRIVLDSAFYADSVVNNVYYIQRALPTPLSCVAGSVAAMSATFLPGYTWAPTDLLANKNNVQFYASWENGSASYPTYPGNLSTSNKDDLNNSFFADRFLRTGSYGSSYYPQYFYYPNTAGATATFPDNNLWMMFHATCASCFLESTTNVTPASAISVYPTVLSGNAQVKITGAPAANSTAVVYDVLGNVVSASAILNNAITLNNVEAGVYIVKVLNGENVLGTQKIVVVK